MASAKPAPILSLVPLFSSLLLLTRLFFDSCFSSALRRTAALLFVSRRSFKTPPSLPSLCLRQPAACATRLNRRNTNHWFRAETVGHETCQDRYLAAAHNPRGIMVALYEAGPLFTRQSTSTNDQLLKLVSNPFQSAVCWHQFNFGFILIMPSSKSTPSGHRSLPRSVSQPF